MKQSEHEKRDETDIILSNDYLMEKIKHGDEQFQAGQFQIHEVIEVD